jgi:hypothetical protein
VSRDAVESLTFLLPIQDLGRFGKKILGLAITFLLQSRLFYVRSGDCFKLVIESKVRKDLPK